MLHLPDLAKQGQHTRKIVINERLPDFIAAPCELEVIFQVKAEDNFYLINLQVRGELTITCQRCVHEFNLNYDNSTVVAVARSDERAEQLLEHYECIVASNWQVSLDDLIIDELHLYPPQFHQQISDCSAEVNEFLTEKIETY